MTRALDDVPTDSVRDALMRHVDHESGLGLWSIDPSSGSLWLSPHARVLLGDAHAPSDATELVERVYTEDRKSFEAMLHDAAQRASSCELRFARGDDTYIALRATSMPARSETAGATTIAGTLTEAANGPFVTRALRAIVAGTGSKYGEDFFRALVINLSSACGTKIAFLADFVDAQHTRVRSFALCIDGQIQPDFEYDLEHTPCEHVASATVCLHPRDVQSLYPRDQLLVDMGIESYLGVPLFASTGEPIGILVVLHDRPLEHGHDLRTILSIFAARAAAEKERMGIEASRAAMEARAHRAEKLESLGLLAGGVAHDFSNYLTALLGHLELSGIALDDGRSPRRNLDAMAVGLRQASELTRQMLSYAGKGSSVSVPVDLNVLIEEVTTLLRASVPKGAQLGTELSSSAPVILADPAQLQQVVMNLVVNGADALSGQPGKVVLRTMRVSLDRRELDAMHMHDGAEPGEYLLLEAEDDGCGMDAEALERAFEPFFTTKPAGRGLGLASLLGIVRALRGAVSVTSAPGEGATFRVYFPSQA